MENPDPKAVADFTAEIIQIMKEASDEVGGPCKKIIEGLRSKLAEKVTRMATFFGAGRGVKRTSSGTMKTGTGHVIRGEDFTSDLSPIERQHLIDDSFDLKKSSLLSDLGLEEKHVTPNAQSVKLKARHMTPSQSGFTVPAPKKRSVQRLTNYTPEVPQGGAIELNLLDISTIEISDYDSDDDAQEEPDSLVPPWAKRAKIKAFVAKQEKIDPDTIFGRVTGGSMFNLAEIFEGWTPNPETKYSKRRTMSGNWTLDQLNLEEEEDYREKMQFLQPPTDPKI